MYLDFLIGERLLSAYNLSLLKSYLGLDFLFAGYRTCVRRAHENGTAAKLIFLQRPPFGYLCVKESARVHFSRFL